MREILRRIGINSSLQKVYVALSKDQGWLAGEPEIPKRLQALAGSIHSVSAIASLKSNERRGTRSQQGRCSENAWNSCTLQR
jgi:hypothetical protein